MTAPAPLPGLVQVQVEDELVLYHLGRRTLHRLDRAATLVWQHLDGVTPVGEVTARIAAATGAPPEQVQRDVDDLLRRLSDHALLADAA